MTKTGLSILAAALAFGAAVPVAAQYTVDTALSDSVLGETRKIGEKPTKSDHMTDGQLAFWRDYCAKWPKREADPAIEETVKWRKPTNPAGVPTWERAGVICTGETYKNVVKLTFARGARLSDPSGLFNASLEGGMPRAIDMRD